ncbi:MAG: SRPBCC family protein [Dehalococcoidia bacterium]|nr:SRPBCC family protein [Dehalococcoidia bacterium]
MRIQEHCTVELPLRKVWGIIEDTPTVLACVPGAETIQAVGDQTYSGVLAIKVGPISAKFAGKATIEEMDPAQNRVRMKVEGIDSRIGSRVSGHMLLQAKEEGGARTRLAVDADINILGALGDLGHWIIKKKASAMMQDFSKDLVRRSGEA